MPNDQEDPPDMPDIGFTPIMMAWWEDVMDWLRDHRPVGLFGGPLVDVPGQGKGINQYPFGIGGTSVEPLPWTFGIAPGTSKIGLIKNSVIFHGPTITTEYNFVGTQPVSSFPPSKDDPNVFECPGIGMRIWVQINTADSGFFDPTVSTCQLNSGETWPGFPEVVHYNIDATPYQDMYILPIAYIADPGEGLPGQTIQLMGGSAIIVRLFSRNVGMVRGFMDGNDILVPSDPAPDFFT